MDDSRRTPLSPRRILELSHPIRHGMITLPGMPAPEVTEYLSREASRSRYASGTEFHIGRICMIANTGTYLDVPFHRYADGVDLADQPLETMVDLPGLVVRVLDGSRVVDRDHLIPFDVRGRAVIVQTGWDRHWGTPEYAVDTPYLTDAAAAWLVERGAVLVGIDSMNIDDIGDGSRPVHTRLLAAGIPIVEHMRGLAQLPSDGFRFHAAPAPVHDMGTFPVRAYAIVDA